MTEIELSHEEFHGFGLFRTRPWGSMFGPGWDGPDHLKQPRGFRDVNGKMARLGKLLLEGYPNRKINETMGTDRQTIRRFRKILVYLRGEIYCGCGRPTNHVASCGSRRNYTKGRKT